MRKGLAIMLGIAAVGGTVAAIALARRDGSKTDDPAKDDARDVAIQPVPTRELPGSGALVFGKIDDREIPRDFDADGNRIRFVDGCMVVLVGRTVWSCNEGTEAPDDPSLAAGDTMCDLIDHLMLKEQVTRSSLIVAAIIRDLEAPCANIPSSMWPEAMQRFVAWLKIHVDEYVTAAGGTVDW